MEDMNNYIIAAVRGIKEFGIGKLLEVMDEERDDVDSMENARMNAAILSAIATMVVPEFVLDEDFRKLVIQKIMAMDKDTLDSICDAILVCLEGGNK